MEPDNKQNDQNIDLNQLASTFEPSPAASGEARPAPLDSDMPHQTPTPPKHKKFSLKHLSKKQKLLLGVGIMVLLGIIGGSVWWFSSRPAPQPAAQPAVVAPTPEEKPIVSNVTGLPVSAKVNEQTVTGVMIENSPDARPQAGLRDADIVYEAVAEGGITRFLALFHDTEPKYIGPIRSARPYYLHWARPFNAGLAHVGGSPEALALIKRLEIRDLDQFGNPEPYARISSRYAPHNMYSGIDKLNALEKSKGYKPDGFKAFVRKEEAAPSGKVTAGSIDFALSGFLYNARFDYNKKDNNYGRSQAGKKHLDDKSGKQITSDVVIALIMKKGLKQIKYTTYQTTGSGSMYVFQDGQVIKGTWKKKDSADQFEFLTSKGEPLALNPGKTWITVVGNRSDIKYKP